MAARTIWRALLWHFADLALSLAFIRLGRSIEARMAMIAMTTRSSMRVKARNIT
jgi:hypothetical protein